MRETENFSRIKNRIAFGDLFETHDIQMVEDWVNETNPNFEYMNIIDAIKEAKSYYSNKKISPKLTAEDINMHNLSLALGDAYNRLGGIDDPIIDGSIRIWSVYPLAPVGDKLQLHVFDYVVAIKFEVMSPAQPERRSAVFTTKDGQYFTFKNFRKDGRV